MALKRKFNPEVTRIKLNPEQAVLACDCYSGGKKRVVGTESAMNKYCVVLIDEDNPTTKGLMDRCAVGDGVTSS